MTFYDSIGVQAPQVLLPRRGANLTQWAVIACDQYTSQPEYWQKVQEVVGDAPSTFNLILPEVFLGTPQEAARIHSTQQTMRQYLAEGLLVPQDGMIYLERGVGGKMRKGIMLCLDLERYDFNPGSQSLIRATEGTILNRLPPRIKIRQGAALELPHILVLIDDPQRTVIEPIAARKASLPVVYDFDLMFDSGHLSGYSLAGAADEAAVAAALQSLASAEHFQAKYHTGPEKKPLLFAVGDGNHSLATAKSIWEQLKPQVSMDHPARFALVEIENVHDEGLAFEPIHRLLCDVKTDLAAALMQFYPGQVACKPCSSRAELVSRIDHPQPDQQLIGLTTPQGYGSSFIPAGPSSLRQQSIGFISPQGYTILTISDPPCNLPVGTLQTFLDIVMKDGLAGKIDYLHGQDILFDLAQSDGNAGFYLPAMPKSDLFKTVILEGALPRKTFSMGEAHEKRFYMECRRIN